MSADSCLPETRPQACHISLPKVYTAHISLLDRKTEAPRAPQHGNGRGCVLFPETVEEGPEDQRGIDPKIAPRMASGFEPAEDFEDRWKDCTVIFGNDELNTVILSPDQQILVETEDQLIYFRDEDAVIPEDEVMQYRVPARCQHLTCGPAKKPRAKADGENVNDNEALILSISDGKSVYIRQSMHMDGPVIASGKNEDKHSAAFDFKGLNLKFEPQKLITGSGTIPHFAVSSKFNLKRAKQLVHAKSLESFYRQEWELRAYNEYASRFMMDLEFGFPLRALAHQAIESCRIKPGDSLRGAFRFPNLSPGERNQLLEEIVSHADIVPDVLQFKAPLTATLQYPEELDEALRKTPRSKATGGTDIGIKIA